MWLFTTVRRIRSHILTLTRRGPSLRSPSSDGRLVDERAIISSNPLANSTRSSSSDGVVDSSSNPIANHFRSDGGLVSKTIISSDLFADYLRSLSDVVEKKSTISSDPKVELIPEDTFRPVETGPLSQVAENKTIISDPITKSVRSPSSDVVVDSKVISSDLRKYHFFISYARNKKTSELFAYYMRSLSLSLSLSHVVENKRIISSDDTFQASSLSHVVENNSSDPLANVELIPDDTFSPVDTVQTGCTFHVWGETVKEDIDYAVRSTKSFINHVLFCEEHSEVVYKAFDVISNHSIFETCSVDTKLKILSTVFDQIQNNCQADAREVYLMNVFLRSMSNDDSKKDLTKKEVMSRVLDVIQSYPKVGKCKVGKKTRFSKDLGFSPVDSSTVDKALYLEFRLKVDYVESSEPSCREISDYIYDNRMKRMEFENFRAHNISGHLFWPRNIYVG